MRWLKENVVRLVSFVVREPMLFVQYIVLASIALVMFTLVMHYKINKSVKKQEKVGSLHFENLLSRLLVHAWYGLFVRCMEGSRTRLGTFRG